MDRASLQRMPRLPAAVALTLSPSHLALQGGPLPFRPGDFAVPAPMTPQAMYPASNLPAMWQVLGPLIQQSTLLREQLDAVAKAGWRIDWAPGNLPACHHARKTITLSSNFSPEVGVQYLAHEVRHALQVAHQPLSFPTAEAYAEHVVFQMEADAVLNQMQVRKEILANSGIDIGVALKDPNYYLAAMAFYERHGDVRRLSQHLGTHYGWLPSGTRNVSYWENAMNDWRERANLPPVSLSLELGHERRMAAKNALASEMQADDVQRLQAVRAAQIAQAVRIARSTMQAGISRPVQPSRSARTELRIASRWARSSVRLASAAVASRRAQTHQATPATQAVMRPGAVTQATPAPLVRSNSAP